jgi:cyclohexanone monooxygenase
MLNEQSKHAAYIIAEAGQRQATVVEATPEAEQAWVEECIRSAIDRQKFAEECTPGYYNNEGQANALAARNGPYGKGSIAFIHTIKKWREAGELAGLALR